MSFIALKTAGKDIIVNTDRIIIIELNSDKKIIIMCTDQVKIEVENPEEEIRKWLGVKGFRNKSIGF